MMHETRGSGTAQSAGPATSGVNLGRETAPPLNRLNIFQRAVALASMAAALTMNEAPAQPPRASAPPPTPAGAPLDPAATPPAPLPGALPGATAEQQRTDISNLTQRDVRFCLDDDGNSLIFRKSQIRKVGQEIQGKPSLGESFRAICEGVEHIKSMNGGVIPPGNDVKLRIVTQNGEDFVSRSLVLNPHTLVSPDKLTPDALNKAMADPGNRKAINAIHEGDVHMHIIRSNEQTARETFIGKDGGSASVTVELSPRK